MTGLMITLPDFLHLQDGEVRLVRHRISLYHVVSRLRDGLSVESVRHEFPTLASDEVLRLQRFYEENRASVDTSLEVYAAELDALFTENPQRITTEVLRRRLALRDQEIPSLPSSANRH